MRDGGIENYTFKWRFKTISSVICQIINSLESVLVFDASPKFPTGVLYGAYYQLGNFDECIGVRQPDVGYGQNELTTIQGKYCLADISFKTQTNDRVSRSSDERKVNNMMIYSQISLLVQNYKIGARRL